MKYKAIFFDDYDIETDGARILGFTSFHIDRNNESKNDWTIQSLREIVDYVEQVKSR